MAVSQTTSTSLNTSLFEDTSNGAAAISVKSSSAVMYSLDVDNTALAAKVYVKLYNVASGSVTVGTTDPHAIFLIEASTRRNFPFPKGWTFDTALTVATVTAPGTGGVAAPATPPAIRIAYT